MVQHEFRLQTSIALSNVTFEAYVLHVVGPFTGPRWHVDYFLHAAMVKSYFIEEKKCEFINCYTIKYFTAFLFWSKYSLKEVAFTFLPLPQFL